MKTKLFSKLAATGLVGLGLLNTSQGADVTVVFAGGNASKGVLYQSVSNAFTGFVQVPNANANIISYTNATLGSVLATNPAYSSLVGKTIDIHFYLQGAVGGIQDLNAQNSRTLATGAVLPPNYAVSSTAPEAVGIDPTPFTQTRTLVIPFVYARDPKWNDISTITNLTRQQAVYLETSAGNLPTTYFGGTNANSNIYLVGRDLAAAVRTEIDANIIFNGTLSSWINNTLLLQTNTAANAAHGNVYANSAIGAIVPDPGTTFAGYPGYTGIDYGPGQPGGSQVTAGLAAVTNSIGTVSSADIGSKFVLSYEGAIFSASNVANGIYPIWGYERWLNLTSGTAKPSTQQAAAAAALLSQVTDNNYQHGIAGGNGVGGTFPTSSSVNQFLKAKFVALGDLNVDRSADGGPITSTLY